MFQTANRLPSKAVVQRAGDQAARDAAHWHGFAALGLAFAVGVAALLPQLLYLRDTGQMSLFIYSADEDFYVGLRPLGGEYSNYRFLSEAALALLLRIFGSPTAAAWAADLIFPAFVALACFVLVRQVVVSLSARLLSVLLLLFGNDLFSLGTFPLWSQSVQRNLRSYFGPWGEELLAVSDSYSSQLFRTPEPQVSLVLMFGYLTLLLSRMERTPDRREWLVLSSATLLVTSLVAHIAVVTLAVVFWIGILLLLTGCKRKSAVFLACWALGTGTWFARLLLFDESYGHVVFSSRLPLVSPSVVAALLGLALAWKLRSAAPRSRLCFGTACFLGVISVMEQQTITGRFVTVVPWESSTNYSLVVLGLLLLVCSRQRVDDALQRELGVGSLIRYGAVISLLALVFWMQRETFERARARNLTIDAYATTLSSLSPSDLAGHRLVYDPPHAGQYAVLKANRLLDLAFSYHERYALRQALLEGEDWTLEGAKLSSAMAFEYFFRLGWSPQKVGDEILDHLDRGSSYFPSFFFNILETNYALSNFRAYAPEQLKAQVQTVVGAYEDFVEGPGSEIRSPSLLLTLDPDGPALANPWWQSESLGEGPSTEGPTVHVFQMRRRSEAFSASGVLSASGTALPADSAGSGG